MANRYQGRGPLRRGRRPGTCRSGPAGSAPGAALPPSPRPWERDRCAARPRSGPAPADPRPWPSKYARTCRRAAAPAACTPRTRRAAARVGHLWKGGRREPATDPRPTAARTGGSNPRGPGCGSTSSMYGAPLRQPGQQMDEFEQGEVELLQDALGVDLDLLLGETGGRGSFALGRLQSMSSAIAASDRVDQCSRATARTARGSGGRGIVSATRPAGSASVIARASVAGTVRSRPPQHQRRFPLPFGQAVRLQLDLGAKGCRAL